MRLTQLSFLILILILLGITSCEKDIEVPQKDNAGTASFIEDRNNPFFDDEAITTITNASIESSIPDWYKQYTKEYLQGQSILIANISSNLGVVCWNCAEIEMINAIGVQYAYFPVISTQSGTVLGLLITKFFDSEVITTYVADLSLLQAVTTNYWPQIFVFFNQKIQGQSPSKDGVFGSRMLACEESGATGFCICRTGESCGGTSNCQQFMCDGNGGGEEEEDGSFPDPLESLDEFYEWLWGSAWWLGDGEGTLEGGGASNPGALNEKGFFNLSYFGGFNDYLIAGLVNDFKRRHDIYMPADQLYNQLLECGVDTYLEFKYDLFTSYQDLSDCIKNIILQNNILHLEEEDGFILTEEEIQEIYPDVMLYSGDFPAYKKTGLINYLKDVLGFSDEAESWLSSNVTNGFIYSIQVYEYLRDNEFTEEAITHGQEVMDWIGQEDFDLNGDQLAWLLDNPDEFQITLDFLAQLPGDEDAMRSVWWSIEADMAGVMGLDQIFTQESMNILLEHTNCCPDGIDDYDGWVSAPDGQDYAEVLEDEILMLKMVHPNWPDILIRHWAQWRLYKEGLHFMLDACGIIEAAGTPCDVTNGVFYAIEGDGVNATMSLLGAVPGGFVVTAGRVVKKTVEIGNKVRRFRWKEIGGKIAFSNGSNYREIWQGVYPALEHSYNRAHHLLPQIKWDNPMLQKAARANPENLPDGVDPFHMNTPANGWPVHQDRHTGSHPNYSNQIEARISYWMDTYPNATNEEAAIAIHKWQNELKALIGVSPDGPNINTLDLPEIPIP